MSITTPDPARTLVIPRQAATPNGFVPASIPMRWPDKRLGEKLDYAVDLTWVLPSGDSATVLTCAVTPVTGAGLTATATAIVGKTAMATLDLGAANTDYTVTLTVGTSQGRTFQFPVNILVQ